MAGKGDFMFTGCREVEMAVEPRRVRVVERGEADIIAVLQELAQEQHVRSIHGAYI